MLNAGFDVLEPHSGDFQVDGITIEVGGQNQSAKQVQVGGSYLIAVDDIETGFEKKIPLWMFGFLY